MPNFPFMPPPALQLPSQVVRHAEGNHVQGPSFADLNLLSGKKAIEQSGLVPSHVAAMQTIASRFNLILMFRPVNRLSTGLLAEGGVAKGMHIKAKTSDWGPMAGLIPADQALSKKWQGLLKQPPQAPLQAQLTESANTSVFPRPLMLSADRLEFLASSDIALIRLPSGWQSAVAKGPCSIEINGKQGVDDQPGKYYKFRLLDSGNGQYGVEYAPTEHHPAGGSGWKTLQVLHAYIGMEPMTEQNLQDDYNFGPITADYDAFAYLPHARSPLLPAFSGMAAPAQAESSDPPVKRSTAGLWKKAVEHLQQHHLGQQDRLHSTPNIGREPAWQARVRQHLNESIASSSNNLVQHATEMDNVYAPEQDDHILVITPDQECRLTQNWSQVEAVMHVANNQGFVGYHNRNYNGHAGMRPIYKDMRAEHLRQGGAMIPFDPPSAYKNLIREK